MIRHTHKFTIADRDAVEQLLDKLALGGPHDKHRDRLLGALDQAAAQYHGTDRKVRQAFFHGLLTGYAVALKLL